MSATTDQWLVIHDTSALLNIVKTKRNSLESLFNKSNCHMVIPIHVLAELDKFSKNYYIRKPFKSVPEATATGAVDEQDADARDSERYMQLARCVAREISIRLPGHLADHRKLTCDEFKDAKRVAESLQLDMSLRSMDADCRILAFVERVIAIVEKRVNVLFVTDDNILTINACQQLGPEFVCRSQAWESIVWEKMKDKVKQDVLSRVQPPAAIDAHEPEITADASAEIAGSPAAVGTVPQPKIIKNKPFIQPTSMPPSLNGLSGASSVSSAFSIKPTPTPPAYTMYVPAHDQAIPKAPCSGVTGVPVNKLILDHINVLKMVSDEEIEVQLSFWEAQGIPLDDPVLVVYFIYFYKINGRKACTQWNGYSDVNVHRAQYGDSCKFDHVCLYCGSEKHGWFSETCIKSRELQIALQSEMLTEKDIWDISRGRKELIEEKVIIPYHHDPAAFSELPVTPITEVAKEPQKEVEPQRLVISSVKAPAGKTDIDNLFRNNQQKKKLTPMLAFLRRLSYGQSQTEVRSKYVAYRNEFTLAKFCFAGSSCYNEDCTYNHACPYCDLDGHDWGACPNLKELYQLIDSVHFELPGYPNSRPRDCLLQLTNSYTKATSKEFSTKLESFVEELSKIPQQAINARKKNLEENKFYLPGKFAIEYVAKIIKSEITVESLCLNFNTNGCLTKGCVRKHACLQCGSSAHGWPKCEERLSLYLELKGLGLFDGSLTPAFWRMIDERRKK